MEDGFSALPALITKHYGLTKTSTIHGLTLSGWAFGGILRTVIGKHIKLSDFVVCLSRNLCIKFCNCKTICER